MSTRNQYLNSVPLPEVDANPDPNDFIQSGDALVAMGPEDRGENQLYVGDAMDEVAQEDDLSNGVMAQLGAGQTIRVTSQEQFDKMSPHEKAIVRTAMATGSASEGGVSKSRLSSRDAVTIYRDSLKQERDRLRQERADEVRTLTLSDGRKIDMINGTYPPAAKVPEPVKRELREQADGLRSTDPSTGESFLAYDKYTGEPVMGKPKISEDNRVQFNQAHIELQRIQSELNQVNAIPTNKKVTQDDNGMWVPSDSFFGGENPAKVKARLLKDADYQSEKIRKIDPTNSVSATAASQPAAAPSPTPTPTRSASPQPTPNPMPTPDKFIVGRTYQDGEGRKATYRGNGVFK